MKLPTILTTALLILALPAPAQISTDGTLGQSINLPGPNYQITPDLGQQHGPNLFHSFRDFNLNKNESANFSGPSSVQNILSRVTGGNPSHIDGLFRTTISGANIYFLNPYGILFGPNARLDVQGSFHASTADSLRLGEDGRFDVRNPSDSILTVAPIESFGFLTNTPTAIQIKDSHLEVQPTQTLSLTGGDISLINTQPVTYDEESHHIFTNQLVAPSGHIILDAQGTVILQNFGVDTNGLFGGPISIRGNRLEMNDSRISSHTFGTLDGQSIDIRVNNLSMQDSDIVANTYGTGHGNNINLQVKENLTATREDRPLGIELGIGVLGTSHITTLTAGPGSSGNIIIKAGNIDLNQAAEIHTRTLGSGKAGDISMQVADTFKATGVLQLGSNTSPASGGAHTMGVASGDNGNIEVTARHIQFTEGAQITSMVLGNGPGGNITINADTVHLNGVSPTGLSASITNVTGGSGHAGRSEVNATQITLEDGGSIVTTAMSTGDANELVVNVADTLIITGVAKYPFQSAYLPLTYYPSNINSASANSAEESGQASNVSVKAKHIVLENGGIISGLTYGGGNGGHAEIIADTIRISGWQEIGYLFFRSGINNSSTNPASYAGQAGNIDITAQHISIRDGGAIDTSAVNAGGGNIIIRARERIYLFEQGRIETSVHGGTGDGGNITIYHPTFTVLDKSQIKAQADAGNGGNIRIVADQLIASPDSLVSASSRLGLDGDVQIESPNVNLDDFLVVLPGSDDEVEFQLPKGCTIEDALNQSTFYVRTVPEGRLKSPEGFME